MNNNSKLEPLQLPAIGSWTPSVHQFDQKELDAIEASEITGRPLLVRGEPGLGKSQLARAVAALQRWPLITHVVNARTEIEDLLYRIDHVRRLSEANLSAATGKVLEQDITNFIDHGPIWRALELSAGKGIKYTKDCFPKNNEHNGWYKPELPGCVLLIDEIDKAPPDVPNALLEVLNESSFLVTQTGDTVNGDRERIRIVITANEERALPAAFIRRCAVLRLDLGKDPQTRLCDIAKAHISKQQLAELSNKVLEYAATYVVSVRERLSESGYRPGSSEYLDLLRVAADYRNKSADITDDALIQMIDRMGNYLVKKSLSTDVYE